MNLYLVFLAIAILGASIQLYHESGELSSVRAYEILLVWLFVVAFGFGNLAGGLEGVINSREVPMIQTGLVFTIPIITQIVLGCAGIFSFWYGNRFRLAVILMGLLFGAGIAVSQNYAFLVEGTSGQGSPGPVLLFSVFIPVLLLVLLYAQEQEITKLAGRN